jgi:hypothetical protein
MMPASHKQCYLWYAKAWFIANLPGLAAGMGRAPATALAYMFWLRGWQLPAAWEALTSVRACSPRIEAIRAATADLLTDSKALDVTVSMRRRGTAQQVQVAGLDVGWHTLLDLQENPVTHRLEVTRQLLPGSYPFKFIIDGTWCPNHDYPTYKVGMPDQEHAGQLCRCNCVHGM